MKGSWDQTGAFTSKGGGCSGRLGTVLAVGLALDFGPESFFAAGGAEIAESGFKVAAREGCFLVGAKAIFFVFFSAAMMKV